ncbi:Major allergen Pru av 1 [Glycine soja]
MYRLQIDKKMRKTNEEREKTFAYCMYLDWGIRNDWTKKYYFGNVMPKAIPNFVKSTKIFGDEVLKSIKKLLLFYGYVNGQPVNQKEDVVEEENYISQYTIDECSVLLDTLEKVCYEYKLVASLDGGYIIKSTIKDYTKGNAQLTQEFLKDN